MRYFCTYFDRNYLVRGLALIESLTRQHGAGYKIYVVCMDEFTRAMLTKLAISQVECVPFHAIEYRDFELLAARENRSAVEYLWTTTPTIILRLLERNPHVDLLTYVDADMYFFAAVDAIATELGEKSVLIHGHNFPQRLKHLEQHGIYNVGLLCFKNDRAGLEVLNWWRARCIEWCYKRLENGQFGDQGYLNDWPTRFPQVRVSTNPGVGVAPWNHDQYRYSQLADGAPAVDGRPLVFYHYHSLAILFPGVIVPAPDPVYRMSTDILKLCILPYADALVRGADACRQIFSTFEFGIRSKEFAASPDQTLLIKREFREEIDRIGIWKDPAELNAEWLFYPGRQLTA